MLKRKVTEKLIQWKNSKRKKSLIVQGARQVGKTFSIREFARENYSEILEINFKEMPSATEIFSGDLDVKSIIIAMRFRFPDKKIEPDNTLIFLDEIQECSEAVTALKFFTEDGSYDVIASGSLLGIDYNRPSSYPVGYVDFIRMYGLDFEEFAWSFGITDEMIASLFECFLSHTPVNESVNNRMLELFRMYIAIGGMPEAVSVFLDSDDFREVDRVQRGILQGYLYDIAHYAKADEKIKAEKCFMSLSKQLLDKENHKFQYKEIEKGARAQKYYSSIEWLLRADVVRLCKALRDIRYDLEDYARDDFFRVYTSDLSLIIPMKDFSFKQHIVENDISGNSRGGIYECAVADILLKKDYSLYFYKNETTKKELDFLIQKDGYIIPIEVKSKNNRANSLTRAMADRVEIKKSIKLIEGNVGENDNIITLPLYMAMFL